MTKMKKLLAVGLAGVLAVSFAACSAGADTDEPTTAAGNAEAANAVKTGYAVISSISDVEDTTLTIDSVVSAVLVDADGKIVDIKIDEAQTKPDLDTDDGNVADLRTKLEKKEDYGMKGVSPIGKEWYEQSAAFEAWAKGKTADEVKACIDAEGNPTDADLVAGCTIHAAGFVNATVAAIENAKDLGASATDTLKLKIATEKYYESNEENLQYDSNIAVVTTDADGKITSCLIDACQAKCSMADGKFTVEEGSFPTKKELGDDYNMKGVSPIGKEWFEQADAFEKWAVGKTADEVKAGIDETGTPVDADLAAGCTIHASAIVATVAEAATVA